MSSLGIPAPYGHACAGCAQSKCKCIVRHVGGPCERCRRLNKDCRPAEMVRRRNPRKPTMSKTARLEEKLDGLVSLVMAGAQSAVAVASQNVTAAIDHSKHNGIIPINANTPTHNESEGSLDSSSLNEYIRTVPLLKPSINHFPGSSGNLPPSAFHDTGGEPSPVEAEENLINFKSNKLKYFPFIYIPSTTKAQDLRQERPLLWLCIMAIGSNSISEQQILDSKIRQAIAQEIVVRSERSIDLLLGLLTFIGWAHCQIQGRPFMSVFSHLAMSLVSELGLNNPVAKDTLGAVCVKEKYLKSSTPRTMEERRAVLGCFLLTSIISSFFQKIDALHWTTHMDESLQILDDRGECPNDEILVQQVRLQLIIEKIALRRLQDEAMKSNRHTIEPTSLSLETLNSQVQEIKAKLLPQPQTGGKLLCTSCSVPLRHPLQDAVLLHLYSTELELLLSPDLLSATQLTLQQCKALKDGLESIKSWFDVFLTIKSATYTGIPFSIFSQLFYCVRCLVMLHQLTTLGDPSWNENDIWNKVEPPRILDRVINNLEQAVIPAGLDNRDNLEGDVFSRAAQMLRYFRAGLEPKADPDDLATFPISQNVNETFHPDAFSVESFDNDWLMDLVIFPNY